MSDTNQENEEVSGTYPLNIGGFVININRKPNYNLYKLSEFDNLMPSYENNEICLKLSKRESDAAMMHLGNSVIRNLYIKDSKEMEREEYLKTFIEIKKKDTNNLLGRIYAMGFEKPSPVQEITIPEIIRGADTIVQFKSGTGKTLSFLVGTLWNFDINDDALQFIFITSSHEVATQICRQVVDLLPKNANISLCIGQKKTNTKAMGGFATTIATSSLNGGYKSIREERDELRKAQVIVCTMGKFYDYFFNKKMIPSVKYLKTIVIDEFDAIITSKSNNRNNNNNNINIGNPQNLSTEKQMEDIMSKIPPDTQRLFFSATLNVDALSTATGYCRNIDDSYGIEPFICVLNNDDYTLEGIKQYYIKCGGYDQKKLTLDDLLGQIRISQAIIFTNKIQSAIDLQMHFKNLKNPINAYIFHGELSSAERKEIHKKLMSGEIRYLISTDVSARGLDIQSVNLVVNFDMPNDQETYIHRVGRSGRYGKKGLAISLVLTNENMNEMLKIHTVNEFSVNNPIIELPRDVRDLI